MLIQSCDDVLMYNMFQFDIIFLSDSNYNSEWIRGHYREFACNFFHRFPISVMEHRYTVHFMLFRTFKRNLQSETAFSGDVSVCFLCDFQPQLRHADWLLVTGCLYGYGIVFQNILFLLFIIQSLAAVLTDCQTDSLFSTCTICRQFVTDSE